MTTQSTDIYLPAMSADRGRWPGSSASQGRGSSSPFRGRVRGFHPHPSQSWRKKAAQPPSPPLGPVLTTLSGVDLAESLDLHESSAGITCWEDVGSYNWLNEVEPTILVPGLHAFFPYLTILAII